MNVDLDASQKLVNVTWKDEQMWVLTKDMKPTDTAETYKFSEKSSLGLFQGVVVIKEKR